MPNGEFSPSMNGCLSSATPSPSASRSSVMRFADGTAAPAYDREEEWRPWVVAPLDEAQARESIRELLNRPNRPTAIFTGFDATAELIFLSLMRNGVSVPAAMSVVNFLSSSAAGIPFPIIATRPTAEPSQTRGSESASRGSARAGQSWPVTLSSPPT